MLKLYLAGYPVTVPKPPVLSDQSSFNPAALPPGFGFAHTGLRAALPIAARSILAWFF